MKITEALLYIVLGFIPSAAIADFVMTANGFSSDTILIVQLPLLLIQIVATSIFLIKLYHQLKKEVNYG